MRFARTVGSVGLLLAFAFVGSGCRHGAALGAGLLAGVAIASALHDERPPRDPIYLERVVIVREPAPVPPAPVAAPPNRIPPEPPVEPADGSPPLVVVGPPAAAGPFPREVAKEALAEAGVATCRSRGVPSGTVQARVTFGNGGTVTRVVVSAPPGLRADALACIGEQIFMARTPPFDGPTVELPAAWSIP
jgi:hypothetical protein